MSDQQPTNQQLEDAVKWLRYGHQVVEGRWPVADWIEAMIDPSPWPLDLVCDITDLIVDKLDLGGWSPSVSSTTDGDTTTFVVELHCVVV